ncbi:MAG: helix-turn-helix domain-containing protein [Pseudomonadota bacterium]
MFTQGTEQVVQSWHAFTTRRVVANEFRVAEADMLKPSRSTAEVAFARQVAMYLAHVVYSMSYTDVAAAFGRERSTVAHACAIIEDARDDIVFEERISKLEDRLMRLNRVRQQGRIESGKSLATIFAGRKSEETSFDNR